MPSHCIAAWHISPVHQILGAPIFALRQFLYMKMSKMGRCRYACGIGLLRRRNRELHQRRSGALFFCTTFSVLSESSPRDRCNVLVSIHLPIFHATPFSNPRSLKPLSKKNRLTSRPSSTGTIASTSLIPCSRSVPGGTAFNVSIRILSIFSPIP